MKTQFGIIVTIASISSFFIGLYVRFLMWGGLGDLFW